MDHVAKDVWREEDGKTPPCAECGSPTIRAFLPESSAHPHGDEVDVWIRHGICNDDGSPKHYTSKAEMAREMKRKGVIPYVRHVGTPGSDKAKTTQRFI